MFLLVSLQNQWQKVITLEKRHTHMTCSAHPSDTTCYPTFCLLPILSIGNGTLAACCAPLRCEHIHVSCPYADKMTLRTSTVWSIWHRSTTCASSPALGTQPQLWHHSLNLFCRAQGRLLFGPRTSLLLSCLQHHVPLDVIMHAHQPAAPTQAPQPT